MSPVACRGPGVSSLSCLARTPEPRSEEEKEKEETLPSWLAGWLAETGTVDRECSRCCRLAFTRSARDAAAVANCTNRNPSIPSSTTSFEIQSGAPPRIPEFGGIWQLRRRMQNGPSHPWSHRLHNPSSFSISVLGSRFAISTFYPNKAISPLARAVKARVMTSSSSANHDR